MKNLFKFMLLILLVVAFTVPVTAQVKAQQYENIVWDNGTLTSNSITQASGGDTTAVFKFKQGEYYPDRLSFITIGIESAGSDSMDNDFTLYLSNDQTYWYSWGIVETLLSTTTAASTVVGSNTIGLAPGITDADEFGAYLYGRFIVTPGTADADTTTCKIQMTRQFIQ